MALMMERPKWFWLACGAIGGISGGFVISLLLQNLRKRNQSQELPATPAVEQQHQTQSTHDTPGVVASIGNTKLIELKSLSRLLGCRVMAKCEFLNPGGSSKDRIAKAIIEDARARGDLEPGATIVEGTSGSTGISLALVARAYGYKCLVVMPDDVAMEKEKLLRRYGATVERVKSAAFANPKHYVNVARQRAMDMGRGLGFFADQFENPSNFRCHYLGTGAEIWRQTRGQVDVFVMGAGTGGTIAGVARFLKERKPQTRVFLVDPQGSGLANKVNYGILYTPEQQERTQQRHRYDTIVEGVGLNRLTANFRRAFEPSKVIDHGFPVTDQEAVSMSQFLLAHEGLFVGSSSALNCCGVVKAARLLSRKGELSADTTIVTILCDPGGRHVTRLWNENYLGTRGLHLHPPLPDTQDPLSFVT